MGPRATLPTNYREHLAGLPPIVAALGARAAARAELDVVNALVPSGSASDAELLAERKKAAAVQLGETVAALERIRLDLLRLHAGAADLAPLTTLIDAARGAGEGLRRLGEGRSGNWMTWRAEVGGGETADAGIVRRAGLDP